MIFLNGTGGQAAAARAADPSRASRAVGGTLAFRVRIRPATLITLQVVLIQFFTIVVFAIQAPLLGPRAFGSVALAMVMVGFCETVITAVATDTLISVGEINESHYATATTMTVAFSLLLGAVMFLASQAAARLAGDAALSPVFKCMAILPLLSAFWAAPNAQAKRTMQFEATVIRSVVSLGLSGIVGVALAFLGAEVWALVAQAIVYRAAGAVALWQAVPLRFQLGYTHARGRELGLIARSLLVVRSMSWATGQIPRFVLGVHLGTVDLGLYSLGARLSDLLIQLSIEPRTIVARIEFRRFLDARGDLSATARRLFALTSLICFPLCVGGAMVTPTLFKVWLDTRWQGGVFTVQMLLLCCLPYVTYYCSTAIFLALNQRGAEAVIAILQALTMAMSVMIAAPFGLDIASLAIFFALLALLPVPLIFLQRRCGIAVGAVVAAQLPALAAAALMGTIVYLAGQQLEASLPSIVALLLLVGLGAVIYVLAIVALAPRMVRESLDQLPFRGRLRRAK